MKKYFYSGWIKLVAVLLVLVSLWGMTAGICGSAFTSVFDEAAVRADLNEILLEQMSAYLLKKSEADPEKMAEMDMGNMDYAVVSNSQPGLEHVDLEDPSVYLYKSEGYDGNYQYEFIGSDLDERYYSYDGKNLLLSLFGRRWYGERDMEQVWRTASISRVVMDEDTGLLYCRTLYYDYVISDFQIYDPFHLFSENDLISCGLAMKDGGMYYVNWDTMEQVDLRNYVSKNVKVILGLEETGIEFSSELIESVGGDEEVSRKLSEEELDAYRQNTEYSAYGIQVVSSNELHINSLYAGNSYMEGNSIYYTAGEMYLYRVLASVNENYPAKDLLSRIDGSITKIYALENWYIPLFFIHLVVFLLAVTYLIKAAGHRAGSKEIHLRWADRVPYLIWSLFDGLLAVLALAGMMGAIEGELYVLGDSLFMTIEVLLANVALLAALWFLLGTVTRIKSGRFLQYTLLYCLWRPLRKLLRFLWKLFGRILHMLWKPFRMLGGGIKAVGHGIRNNFPFFVKYILAIAACFLVEIVVILIVADAYWIGEIIVTVLFFKVLEGILLVAAGFQMKRLQDGSAKIAAGDTTPIDTKGMFWEFKKHGENINKVGDGISAAVAEQMKSERFKTELITNVSHDIKTPLTSIINYVDLMKKLDITDPTMLEYMDVLDRQSARLKKLIEDLMEASKASTGNLEVNLEKCNISVLFVQMVGEFEERAKKAQLDFVLSNPEGPIYIMADSRHIWRVFDNLLSNACKYAMPGTRVYMDMGLKGDHVEITLKNISRSQLNISSEELMERFVRGDSSRNTEGSGLGLSIAQSLTDLMGGTMALDVDGDLFKVILTFPLCMETNG